MSKTQDSLPLRSEHDDVNRAKRWNDLLGRGLFETAIVALGVFLALAVDEWREQSQQRELAGEARSALHAELLSNRDSLIERFRTTAAILAASAQHPSRVGQFVFERRNRPLLVNDAAWTMTVETGAIRWLRPEERAIFARVYAGHERMREVVANELVRWTELGGFAQESSLEESRERDRAVRIWQAYAQRTQFAICMNLGRHEQALGALIPDPDLTQYCVSFPATRPPSGLYSDWMKRNWVSPTPPMAFSDNRKGGGKASSSRNG